MWVPGHSGIMGNELADYMAKKEVSIGKAMNHKDIATPAGIRHHFRITQKTRQVKDWDRNTLRGYTYIYTDKGALMHWLHRLGRKDSSRCRCGEGAVQNAVHILKCTLVWDGKGRTLAQVGGEPEFCAQVPEFLQAQLD